MPINFEQPSPVGQFPEGFAAAGIVSQFNKDREFGLQQAALQSQAAQANANRAAAAQAQQGHLQLQAGQQRLQAQALGQQGQVTPAMQYAAEQQQIGQENQFGQQQALGQQHFAQQQQLQRQAIDAGPPMFTQGDSIAMAKAQQSQSLADQKLASGEWDQGEYDDATSLLKPQIAAYQQKQDAAGNYQQQKGQKQAMHATAAQTTMALQNGALIAKSFDPNSTDNTFAIDRNDPNSPRGFIDLEGKPHFPPAHAAKAADAGPKVSTYEAKHAMAIKAVHEEAKYEMEAGQPPPTTAELQTRIGANIEAQTSQELAHNARMKAAMGQSKAPPPPAGATPGTPPANMPAPAGPPAPPPRPPIQITPQVISEAASDAMQRAGQDSKAANAIAKYSSFMQQHPDFKSLSPELRAEHWRLWDEAQKYSGSSNTGVRQNVTPPAPAAPAPAAQQPRFLPTGYQKGMQ